MHTWTSVYETESIWAFGVLAETGVWVLTFSS